MIFKMGQTVDSYQFLELLDTVGLGACYKARNLVQDRLESLRFLARELEGDPHAVDRLWREIKIHSRLVHPNIARFHGASRIENQLAIATEFVDGVTLNQRLKHGPIPLPEGCEYLRQALAGLGYAHQHSVIHRCVAPANLLITADGVVKLTGFSFAKTPTDPNLTGTGFVVRMASYLSPEQVINSPIVDARSDLYSLGAVLYEVVSGQPPFLRPSVFETLQAHVRSPARPPSQMKPSLPLELDRIILRALAKDPAQRFQTAEHLRDALDGLACRSL